MEEQLDDVRKNAGITQEQAARLLSITLRTYQRWEAGQVNEAKRQWAARKIKELTK